MSIMITGGTGFLGVNLANYFASQTERTIILYDIAPKVDEMLKGIEEKGKVIIVQGDILDLPKLLHTVKTYTVKDIIHTAAILPPCQDRPYQTLKVNIEGTVNVLEAACIINKIRRIVFLSSNAVYGRISSSKSPVSEDHKLNPFTGGIYGVSKACGEFIGQDYRVAYGVDFIAVRVAGVYGPGQRFINPPFLFLRCALENVPYELSEGGDYLWSFTYSKDIVQAIGLLLNAKQLKYPVYNISSGEMTKLSEVAEAVKAVFPHAQIKLGPGIFRRVTLKGTFYEEGNIIPPERFALDNSRIRSELGFRPKYNIREGIKDFAQWLCSGKL